MEAGAGLAGGVKASPPGALQTRLSVLTTLPPDRLNALLADDPKAAAPWVRAAAEAGLPEGQVRFGRMLLDGAGVEKDEAAAYGWFRRAADQGDSDARNMVGRCFENGWGVRRDPGEAARWFARAADAGHAWAQYNLGHLYLDGLGVERDRRRAFALYRQAAESGHVRAMNLLARCYEEGWGVEASPGTAEVWYRRSAEGGYFRGQYNLATLRLRAGAVADALAWFDAALKGAPAQTRSEMARRLATAAHPALKALGHAALAAEDRGAK
jgi:TPR repeat protein